VLGEILAVKVGHWAICIFGGVKFDYVAFREDQRDGFSMLVTLKKQMVLWNGFRKNSKLCCGSLVLFREWHAKVDQVVLYVDHVFGEDTVFPVKVKGQPSGSVFQEVAEGFTSLAMDYRGVVFKITKTSCLHLMSLKWIWFQKSWFPPFRFSCSGLHYSLPGLGGRSDRRQ